MKEHPSTVTQNTNQHEGTNDTLTRWYNLYWGALTDTHLQLMDDGSYILLGSRLCKSKWEMIHYNRIMVTAPNTSLPHTWDEVMRVNHLIDSPITYNGQYAIAMVHDEGFNGEITIPPASSIIGSGSYYGCISCCNTPAVDDF